MNLSTYLVFFLNYCVEFSARVANQCRYSTKNLFKENSKIERRANQKFVGYVVQCCHYQVSKNLIRCRNKFWRRISPISRLEVSLFNFQLLEMQCCQYFHKKLYSIFRNFFLIFLMYFNNYSFELRKLYEIFGQCHQHRKFQMENERESMNIIICVIKWNRKKPKTFLVGCPSDSVANCVRQNKIIFLLKKNDMNEKWKKLVMN